MGVQGLWTVLQPCARPVKLETLNKKRLAVDASIWIYQFLKAVRDKEGNALRNSHIVGFFRRICKLLYFGIKPVFVFDGGAPILKRQTIANRKKRREGRREDAVRTASKLLAVQLQRTAEQEVAKRRNRSSNLKEENVPDHPVYVDEAFMTEKERHQSRTFKKKDAYHLPELQVSLEEMGAPNDPRIMSREELEEYARQFHEGEDINLYDFSKIDFDSPFFLSLPATDRYNILNAARLRSRLRMGYSKEQLDNMFPDRMAFSKFQIERVKERNDLTQRLMNINGMNGEQAFYNSGQRIAGERGREYVLVQDSAVEGGWVLGVVGSKEEGREEKPIDVDRYFRHEISPERDEVSDDEGGFEDVPIEGLNRLPKLPFLQAGVLDESIRKQMHGATEGPEADSLFVQDDNEHACRLSDPGIDDVFEGNAASDDEDLQRAIAMSLESAGHLHQADKHVPEIPINRSLPPAALPKETTLDLVGESDDDELDFAAALAQSKKTERVPARSNTSNPLHNHPFAGPLPFETLKPIKPSNIEKLPRQEDVEQDAGGFEKQQPSKASKENLPLPPWFSGKHQNSEFITDRNDNDSLERYRDRTMTPNHLFLKDHRSPDVIDVDQYPENHVIDLDQTPEPAVAGTSPPFKGSNAAEKEVDGEQGPSGLLGALSKDVGLPEHTRENIQSDKDVYEWEATDDEKTNGKSKAPTPHAERSPSPEFEDVAIQSEERIIGSAGLQNETEIGQSIGLMEEDDFSDPEDEELLRQLAAEGEEHVRFAATLNSAPQAGTSFDYEQELKQLRAQQKKDRRDADEVSQIMITECQQLLTLFGLPYITAPMEAEAQCAVLVELGLVDGIITDDSDIFLFGGTRVYKNMFNQSKYVECYLTSDLEKEYALHRRKLISFAHILGSDYTEGIPGIGPVTALEILTEFSSLEEFRDWWTQVQTKADMSNSSHAAFYKRFNKQATKIFLPPSFPDSRVDVAYLEPQADKDPSPFQWGVPDLHGLRNFLMATIGWSQERTDEILVPVIRDMNRREQEGTQSNITNFFNGPQGAGAFAPRVRSGGQSRMEKAFSRLRREAEAAEAEGNNHPHVRVNEAESGLEDSAENQASSRQAAWKGKGNKRDAPKAGDVGNARAGDDMTAKKRKTRNSRKI